MLIACRSLRRLADLITLAVRSRERSECLTTDQQDVLAMNDPEVVESRKLLLELGVSL